MMKRKFYPDEMTEFIRSEIEQNLKSELGLLLVDTGRYLYYGEQGPSSVLPAVLVDQDSDVLGISSETGSVDCTYNFLIHFMRRIGDGDRPQDGGLKNPPRRIREFFMQGDYQLETFPVNDPYHCIESAFPEGECVYGEPEELQRPNVAIDQATFPLVVRVKLRPQQS